MARLLSASELFETVASGHGDRLTGDDGFERTGLHVDGTHEAQPLEASKRHSSRLIDTGRGLRRRTGRRFEKTYGGRSENYPTLITGLRR
jgi:hypothetical protein